MKGKLAPIKSAPKEKVKNIHPEHIGQGLGANSNEQWEMHLDATDEGNDKVFVDAFNPRSGPNRPTMHRKVNVCDH